MNRIPGEAVAVLAAALAVGACGGSSAADSRHLPHVILTAKPVPASRGPTPATYARLVWSDNFNGRPGGRPKPSRWRYDTGVWDQGSRDVDTSRRANVQTDGHGRLVIAARRRTATGSEPAGRPFTSGRIETAHRFSFVYGRLEARIKIPAGAGLWPAFWLLGDSIDTLGWPRSGEVDVMENFGQQPGTVFGTIHGPVGGGRASSFQVRGRARGDSLARGFHTYGVVWQPGRITWTIDGKPYGTARAARLPKGSWVFDNRPFHIVISLAVGGPDVGPPTAATRFPAKLLVDWVRLFQ